MFLAGSLSLDFSSPKVMGILNVTPDSFSDGGRFTEVEKSVFHAETMISQGAEIIDIGGESTRPGSEGVSVEEELRRVIPVISAIKEQFSSIPISVDTTKCEVARQALELGVHFINDISGLRFEPRLADLCAEFDAPLILMHSIGNPKTMQVQPTYKNVVEEVYEFLARQSDFAQKKGVSKIIVDPGLGFGKTLEHNIELVRNLNRFSDLGFPILVGASRKSMIGQILGGIPSEKRVIGTVAVHYECLIRGATILRVHDVKESSDSIRIFQAINPITP